MVRIAAHKRITLSFGVNVYHAYKVHTSTAVSSPILLSVGVSGNAPPAADVTTSVESLVGERCSWAGMASSSY